MSEPSGKSLPLRVALRAYPLHWRATREAELLGVLRDSVPERRHWPGFMALVDLVVGGWRTRWQMHPPFWRWAGYRFLDLRLPPRWRTWARDDITGRWWPLRRLPLLAILIAVWAANPAFTLAARLLAAGVFCTVTVCLAAPDKGRVRRKALNRHVPASPALVLWVPTPIWVPAPPRPRVAPSLFAAGALLTIGAPFATWTLLHSSDRLGSISGVTWAGVSTGGLIALLVVVARSGRVARRLASRTSGQPGTTPASPLRRSSLVRAIAIQAGIETLTCLGQLANVIPALPALVLASGGICIGPLLAVLAYQARQAERSTGIIVTSYDCRQAILSREPEISPERGRWVTIPQPVPVEGPLPR